jgi:hypothetical protein
VQHEDLVNLALSVHGSVLVATIVAYYKYGDRTEMIEKGLRGSDSVLMEMRRRISSELADALEEYFQASQSSPTITSGQNAAYIERVTNPSQSEGFRETIRDFVESQSTLMADYRNLLSARASWCTWGRCLSWTLLVLLIAEVITVGILGFVDKLAEHTLQDWAIRWSWLPVAGLVGAAILPLPFMLLKHDIITKCKIAYEAF